MDGIFQVASKIGDEWSLAAFGIAAVLFVLLKKRGKVPVLGWICIIVLVLGATGSSAYVRIFRSRITNLYRVRVTILDPDGTPVDQARVWSSLGGEAKKVSGGWEFDIPAGTRPPDGKLSLFATESALYPAAQADLILADNYWPTTVIRFQNGAPARIHGMVMDTSQKGIEGALIRVVGYESEKTLSQESGQFDLSTHVRQGEDVLLHVEKQGYLTVEQLQPTGNEPATIVLSPSNPQ